MKFNPNIHHRRSIRLKGYDYSSAGYYFITMCTKNRLHMFGEIRNNQMILNNAGKMVQKWWILLANKFNNIELHEKILMPNHFHGIIQIKPVGADQHVRLKTFYSLDGHPSIHSLDGHPSIHSLDGHPSIHSLDGHVGPSLHVMVQWFKTMSTNEYIRNVKQNGWRRFDKKLWQRDYYEHIIRDDNALQRISKYIQMNPTKWHNDYFS